MKRRSMLASAIALLASIFAAGCASQSTVSPGAVKLGDCCCCCCDPNCEPGCCPECPPDCASACCDDCSADCTSACDNSAKG